MELYDNFLHSALTKSQKGSSIHWGYAFWICAGLYGIGTVIFLTLGKIEVQEFNYKEYSKSEEENFATFLPTYRKTEDNFWNKYSQKELL